MKRIDLTGQRFGRLTVIRYDHSEHDGVHWLCKCDCGNEKVAAGYSLRSGKSHHAEQFHLRTNAILRLSRKRSESGQS